MYGNELNYLATFFTIGYALFLIPSQIVITKIKPNHWLPPLELLWGAITAICAVVKNIETMYGLRFIIGAAESSAWPGMITIFMNWYTPTEFATRAAFFAVAGSAGNMVAGALQAALYKNLNGAHGIAGWRWMFLINGIMTIVISLIGHFAIPDTEKGALWMNDHDLQVARGRMKRVGRETKADFRLVTFKHVLSDYRVWLFLGVYGFRSLSQKATHYFNLFIKSMTLEDGVTPMYNVEQVNLMPMIGYGTEMIAVLFYSRLSDMTGKGHWLVGWQLILTAFALAVLAAWPPSYAFKFSAYIILFSATSVTPILMSWMARVWKEFPERRALITAIAVLISYANEAWMVIVLWPAKQAPHYKYGFKVSCGFIVCSFIFLIIFYKKVGTCQ